MAKMSDILEAHTRQAIGPFAIVRTCRHCAFFHLRRKGGGRGAGFREGNKQRGILYQHLKDEHPEVMHETS